MLPTFRGAASRSRSDRAGPPAYAAWRWCPHCWGQRRVIEYRQAANGEGRIPRVETCRTCLGIGEVIL